VETSDQNVENDWADPTGSSDTPSVLGAQALEYATRGLSVFPVWWAVDGRCGCGNPKCMRVGKHPIVARGFKEATTDPKTIRDLWLRYPEASIGIATGLTSKFDVLDVDTKQDGLESLTRLLKDYGIAMPTTPTARTGGGGLHYFFAATGTTKSVAGALKDYPGIDTKGEGGYIIAAPSSHESGKRYEWLTGLDVPFAPWPSKLLELLAKPSRNGNGNGPVDPEDDGLTGVKEGNRNASMVEWVGRWIRKGLMASQVLALAQMRNLTNDPPLDDEVVESMVERIWEKDRSTSASTSEGLDLVQASEITVRNVPWVWPGYFPRGAMTLIVGDPEVNKTTVGIDYHARVTSGRPFPNGAPGSGKPEPVIFLSAEDSPGYTLIPRFLAAGGNRKLLYVINSTIGAPMFSLETDIAQLENSVRETGARHIVIDPLNAYLPRVDSWKDTAIRGALSPLAALAEQMDLDVLGIMHLNKKSDLTALQRVMGSTGYVAMARAVYLVAKDPDNPDRRLFLCSKMSVAEKPPGLAFVLRPAVLRRRKEETEPIRTLAITWDTSTPVTATADSVLQRRRVGPGEQATQLITELLSAGPVPAEKMEQELEAAGLAERTISRAKEKAGVLSIKSPGADGPWYWTPPGFTATQRQAWLDGKRAEPSDEGEGGQ
jgi:bifunctional DNA primase/polymerase-like protein/AAA domain-containing protein